MATTLDSHGADVDVGVGEVHVAEVRRLGTAAVLVAPRCKQQQQKTCVNVIINCPCGTLQRRILENARIHISSEHQAFIEAPQGDISGIECVGGSYY